MSRKCSAWLPSLAGLATKSTAKCPARANRPGRGRRDYYSLFVAKIAELEQPRAS